MKHWPKATPLLWLLLAAPAAAAPTVTEFPLPTASAVPEDIVLGPDGKLWFAEKDADKIGRVTPGDPTLIEEFDVPTNFTDPFNITVGPDNKIWFSGIFNNAGGVGRMNPANPIDTQGQGGYGVATAAGIAAGPDGAIWLGDQGGQVVRIDPATMNELAISDIPITGFNIRNLSPGPPRRAKRLGHGLRRSDRQGRADRAGRRVDDVRRAGRRRLGHRCGPRRQPLVHGPGGE